MAFANDHRRNVDAIIVLIGKNGPSWRTKRDPLEMEMRNRAVLEASGYPFVAAEYPLFFQEMFCQQIRWAVVIRTARLGVACSLLLFFLMPDALGQAPEDAQQPQTTESEYRKFDSLLSFLRARNVQQYAISSAKGIDESQFVSIGGIEQWVTIRGWDRDNPVLLFLHGGPGDVTNPWTFALFAPWEKHFTVVQWDQRGAGRTLRKTGPTVASTITVDRMVQDGIELSEYLRKRLGKGKIIIVGHSFGSIIGVLMARARPDLFCAYVGTGQVADETRNYFVAYDELLKKARAEGNQQAFDELSRVGPPPYASGEGYSVQRKWANAFEGADQFLLGTIGLALVAPGNSVQDINDSVDGQMLSGERLVPQTKSSGPKDLGFEFSIPMFFIQGAEDFTAPTALARNYLDSIKAPRKEFVTIKDGGHFAVFMHSGQFLQELVRLVGPLTVKQ
jgi:pimeloyl-ACP methyl ester carboxylesterase